MQSLAITRYSIVNCLGTGAGAVGAALRDGRSGLVPCDFEGIRLATYVGRVPGLEVMPVRPELSDFDCRNNRLAQLGLETDGFAGAVARAAKRYGAARIGIFVGTSTSGILHAELAFRHRDPKTGALPQDFRYAETQNTGSLAEFTRRYLGLKGPGFVVSSACSSSAKVFGNAARMIAAGVCDAAVVGGVDTLCLTTLCGFHSLQLTASGPCRPFDAERDGISIGEGAGFALVERVERAAEGRHLLLGVGESCDAHHMSTPHPEGIGAGLAMLQALASAGLDAPDIDYINLHGTASRANDASEDKAVSDRFGAAVPCSSTKGSTGHLLGAAGITEAVISLLAISGSFMPGGVNTRRLDPALRSRFLMENREGTLRRVLSNSFGFGGTNCSLILGAAG